MMKLSKYMFCFYFPELNLIAIIKVLTGLLLNYQKISSGVWVYVEALIIAAS